MIFDRLCGIVERVYRNDALARLLKQARIFEFPGRLHEVAAGRDWESVGGAEFLAEHFFLPFPVVAIEDTASCIVIVDEEPDQRGLGSPRTVVECLDLRTPPSEFRCDTFTQEHALAMANSKIPPGACSIAVSRVLRASVAPNAKQGKTGLTFAGELGAVFLASKDEMVFSPANSMKAMEARGDFGRYQRVALENAVAGLEEIMWFNTPDRFIVERSPDAPLDKGVRPNPIVRSPHRPHYIMLRPGEIRERLGMSDEPVQDRQSPTPHARRRHYRTLKSDRFVNAQGRTVVVNASWVGPAEGEYKGRRYRVCLEL